MISSSLTRGTCVAAHHTTHMSHAEIDMRVEWLFFLKKDSVAVSQFAIDSWRQVGGRFETANRKKD